MRATGTMMQRACITVPTVACMRTTVRLDEDVARAVEALRRERGLGTSEALNELARRGLAMREDDERTAFRQRTSPMGEPKVPLDDVAEALDLLEGEGSG